MVSNSSAPNSRLRLGLILALVAAAFLVWLLNGRGATSQPHFLNTDSAVAYVGSEACKACHAAECASYGETPHGRSFGSVDPKTEPLPGTFDHGASGLSYEMYEKDGRMRMREFVRLADGSTPTTQDHAIRWYIGSGAHTRSYGLDVDGFITEAPATHYASIDAWAMTPSYDKPDHLGFARIMDWECLTCHVGRVELQDGNQQRPRIIEEAIGCENCHGAGSLHVAHWEKNAGPLNGVDLTIVNPRHLDRRLSMDLCGRCHQPIATSVDSYGQNLADWRPGLPLSRFRTRFRQVVLGDSMGLESHPDQLAASRCYKASGTLRCITCHVTHERPAPSERAAYYRAKCLSCHDVDACGEDPSHRLRAGAADDCTVCHMPRTDTEVPHITFNNHRIAVRRPDVTSTSPRPSLDLVPVDDVSHLSQEALDRDLGLAYFRLAWFGQWSQDDHRTLAKKAESLLHPLVVGGMNDPEVDAALVLLQGARDPIRAKSLAERALRSDDPMTPGARGAAYDTILRFLGPTAEGEVLERHLERLTKFRRNADDWSWYISIGRRRNDRALVKRALRMALEIGAHNPAIQQQASVIYEWLGDAEQAAEHRRLAEGILSRRAQARRR